MAAIKLVDKKYLLRFIDPKGKMDMRRYQTAFTLIELLIVVAIIGILAAIIMPNFLNAQIKANLARVKSEHATLANAFEQYYLDHNSYPTGQATSADNYQGYRRLTTPVPYLTHIMDDPFKWKYVTSRGNDYDVHYEFMTTRHQTGSRNQRASSSAGNNFATDLYNIEGVGPDGTDTFKPTNDYPSHPALFEFYDPSNGLRSTGDILRAGGVYLPRWYREGRGGPSTTGDDWI